MKIAIIIFSFIGFLWVTFLTAVVLCFYKHMNKPKADCLIDEMDMFIKDFGGKKDELK